MGEAVRYSECAVLLVQPTYTGEEDGEDDGELVDGVAGDVLQHQS